MSRQGRTAAAVGLVLMGLAAVPRGAATASTDCDPAAAAALDRVAAAWRLAEGDDATDDARAAYTASPACAELGTASWAGTGWIRAAMAASQGGSSESLEPVLAAVEVLESGPLAATPGRAYAVALLRAAAAAAQHERQEMRVWIEHAEGLSHRLPAGERPWPLPFDVAEGELWIAVEDYDLAQAAFERALAAAPTPIAMRGLGRARARRGDVPGACPPFRRALELAADRPDGSIAQEARAFLRLCP
jgi:tetratricopeptide (TPR) repeat protein